MNGIPLPQVSEMEKLRRELLSGKHTDIPEDCVAIRTSKDGKQQFLTEEEYKKLLHYD